MEVEDHKEPQKSIPKKEKAEAAELDHQSQQNENNQTMEHPSNESSNCSSKIFEIDNFDHLVSRSGKSSESNLKKKILTSEGNRVFSGVNIFSAFKSPDDYMIAEYGRGYALFVEGKLKKAERHWRWYIDLVFSPICGYCALEQQNKAVFLFDVRGESPPKKIIVGKTWTNTGTPNLILFPKNPKNMIIRLEGDQIGILDLEKEKLMTKYTHQTELISVVCSGRDLVIILKGLKHPEQAPPTHSRNYNNGFLVEVNKLKLGEDEELSVIEKFKSESKSDREKPLFLTLGPREKHLLISTTTTSSSRRSLTHILRMSSQRKLTYLTRIEFPTDRSFGCFQFHGYKKTKMIFSGVERMRQSRIFTVVYDFKSKKVALVRIVRTGLGTARRMTLFGSTLYGVDDYCKKFEVRV